ncbi:MAG: 50S ribosomal protein L9 [Chloroherpetonaceae bacterium]|nr:50S ribosomal protein L9 [Chthonomonadaceae bacterium]MDW8207448.1 50S ribosomal protein L9 [Chloroherpetonaceae bacterium]
MKVILTRDVPKVGKDGDVVTVADGYARNYLFPRQLAVVATRAALKQHENRIARELARSAEQLATAKQQAEKIQGQQLQILARSAAGSTRLFGSVTAADVAAALQRVLEIEVDKRKISLIDPIKQAGVYELTVKLHPEVVVSFSVDVVTEEILAERERQRAAEEERQRKAAEASSTAAAGAPAAEDVADTAAEV